ncbi:outer membrane protein assembly factor [Hymenobacter sp. BT175]|uniref:BamA/TamA family outer membrane protein n=1 Tax=Hymenobacter translucens TaxID=2886507 RepID=UPI001D0F1E51|nr:BamA/TamA family outer membrane protein [Hymenobacter translucens]MCC2547513.1 outer membrane protein assembly factor [Hymenobacter translucens]
MRYSSLLLGLSLLAGTARGQTAPADSVTTTVTSKRDKPSFIPIPVLFSQPETGLGFGIALLPVWRFGTDTLTRKSNARFINWYTQKKQILFQHTHSVFTPGEKYLLTGEASYYYDFPINYYGFGPRTRREDESGIKYKLLILNERVLKKVVPNLFVGGQYRLTNIRDIEVTRNIDDTRPSLLLQRDARERQNTLVSGIGPALLYDGRDNVLSAYHGNYLELSALFNGGALGSDYRFSRYLVDARHYQPLGSEKTIFASQLIGQFHTGDVPFRELANLGGDKIMRGYYEGRYRDRQLLALQAEVRRYLFWRINGVLFGSVGQIGDTFADFDQGGVKAIGGAGIRLKFNRRDRLNIRFDYGVGRDGSKGFYFSFGEAF